MIHATMRLVQHLSLPQFGSCLAVFTVLLCAAHSQQNIYSTGFEEFNPGTIVNQQGWTGSDARGGSQSIVSAFRRSGEKSLFWDNFSSALTTSSVARSLPSPIDCSALRPFEASVWVYIDSSTVAERRYAIALTPRGLLQLAAGISIAGNGAVRAGTNFTNMRDSEPFFTDASAVGQWVRLSLRYYGDDEERLLAEVYRSDGALVASREFYASLGFSRLTTLRSLALGTFALASNQPGIAYMDDLQVRVASAGDVNGDGCVDDSDLLRVLFGFGESGLTASDVNRDGTVDDDDLLTVLFQFGEGC